MHASLISPASCRFTVTALATFYLLQMRAAGHFEITSAVLSTFYLLLMLFRGLLQNCRNRLDGLPLLTSVWV